jgi:protein TonB
MRRDLLIGLAVSIMVHGGAVVISIWSKGPPPPPPKSDAPSVQVFEMPKIEPETPDEVDDTQQQTTPVDFSPPTQADVPQIANTMDFTQQVEPPPNVAINRSALTVPKNTGNWMNGMRVFTLGDLDVKPVPTFQPNPTYPFEMRRAGITGTVMVDFIVDPEGNVIDAYAESSSQHDFEANAIQGVARWKFRPGRKGGRAVATRMQVPIQFSLNSEE